MNLLAPCPPSEPLRASRVLAYRLLIPIARTTAALVARTLPSLTRSVRPVRRWRQTAHYDAAPTTPVPAAVKAPVRRDRQLASRVSRRWPSPHGSPGP